MSKKNKENATKVAKVFNNISVILLCVGAILPFPILYRTVVFSSLIFPVLGLFVLKAYEGIIKVSYTKKNTPNVNASFLIIIVSVLKVMRIHYFFSVSIIWLTILCSVLIGTVMLLVFRKAYKPFGMVFLSSIAILAYSYCLILSLNVYLDNSEHKKYTANVISKYESRGHYSTVYYLDLSGWANQYDNNRQAVPSYVYNNVEVGEDVQIALKSGKFNINWYQIYKYN